MKKTVILSVLCIALVSACNVLETASAQRRQMRQDFTVVGNVVHYKSKPFAQLQAMTWSLDGGELVKEMNFKLLEREDLSLVGGMIDFLSDRHSGEEIEVEFAVEENSTHFKL